MPKLAVADGAVLKCDAGSASSMLTVTTDPLIEIEGALVATIFDHQPGANIKPFGVCAITGGPCVPVTPAPWMSGEVSILLASMFPILPADSTLKCVIGGAIRIISPGQSTLFVDSLSALPFSLLADLVSALLSLYVDLLSALSRLADMLPEPSPTYQRLWRLILSSGIKEALNNVGNMTVDEKLILNDILSLPGAKKHVKELLSGAYVRIHDGGMLAGRWANFGSFYRRPSSHDGTIGAVNGPLSHTILFGAVGPAGPRYTWVQLERNPTIKWPPEIRYWHPDIPFIKNDPYYPYPDIDPERLDDQARHLADAIGSDPNHNRGPYGRSSHTEEHNPIDLFP